MNELQFIIVKENFNNLHESEKIDLWNEFCDKNYYYSDKIYSLDGYMLESFFTSIEDFAKSVSSSDHFNYNDNYFKVGDVYNDILTSDYFEDLAEPDDDFYEFILEKYPDFIEEEEEEGEEEE